MKRVIPAAIGLACAGLLALLTAGCSGTSTAVPQSSLEKTNLTVAAVPVADEIGLYIAKDEGLFRAEGLNVTIDSIVSSAVAAAGQNDGKYDITAGNSVSYIQEQVNRQSDLEIVAEGSLMQPGNQGLYTLPGSQIRTITELRGARIGVNVPNNIGTLLISSVLTEHGLSPGEVHFVPVTNGFPGMAQALQQRAVDVAWLPEPFGSAEAMNYGLTQLADLDQGATQDFPVGWYVATKAWATKHPHTLAAFLAALRQGQQVADADRAAVEQAMEKLPGPYTVPAVIASVMSAEAYPLNTAPHIDATRVQRVANAMYEFQMLKQPFMVSSMLTP